MVTLLDNYSRCNKRSPCRAKIVPAAVRTLMRCDCRYTSGTGRVVAFNQSAVIRDIVMRNVLSSLHRELISAYAAIRQIQRLHYCHWIGIRSSKDGGDVAIDRGVCITQRPGHFARSCCRLNLRAICDTRSRRIWTAGRVLRFRLNLTEPLRKSSDWIFHSSRLSEKLCESVGAEIA